MVCPPRFPASILSWPPISARQHPKPFNLRSRQPTPRETSLQPTAPLTIISNALNLHRHPLRQLLDGNTAPRGLVGKVLLEHAVHLGEVRHVVQEHVHLDDFLNGRVGFLQDGQDVLAALGGFVGDAAGDQGAGFVGGDLARDEDVGAGDYGLGLCGGGVSF